MTTALEGGEGSASRPSHSLPLGKTRYPLHRRLGGPRGWSGQVQKISPYTGIRSLDRPARSQSLYRLSYLAHHTCCTSCLLVYVILSHHCFLSLFMFMSIIFAPSLLSNYMSILVIKSSCHILLLNLAIRSWGLLRVFVVHSIYVVTVQSCTYLLLCASN